MAGVFVAPDVPDGLAHVGDSNVNDYSDRELLAQFLAPDMRLQRPRP